MNINLVADASVSSAPAGFTSAIQAAAGVYEQDFPGNYTVNISYGWGTYAGDVNSELTNTNISLGGSEFYGVDYNTAKTWLDDSASLDDQKEAYRSLPADASALPGDPATIFVSSAQEKALSVFGGDSGEIDGSIGFGTKSYDWEELALVEIGHALGWSTGYSPGTPTILDLFRYASAGQYQFTGGQPAYFSIDSGKTDLANYATTFDYTLFQNLNSQETFQAPETNTTESLSSLDLEVLNLLGFGSQLSLPATIGPPIPVPGAPSIVAATAYTPPAPSSASSSAFSVDGSQGVQTLAGAGSTNFIDTIDAAGTGTTLVDLRDGDVMKGSQLDAELSNIQGVQLGSDPSVVLGLTSGVDLLYGGSRPDQFYNQGGIDYIKGGSGYNAIVGGSGMSLFYSSGGTDTMKGGQGQNFMQAGQTPGSSDAFYGGGGTDFVYGGIGSTILVGASGTEDLTGGSGYNELIGSNQSAGYNIFNDGSGTNVFYAGIGTNLLYEATGTSVLAGNAGSDFVYGGSGGSFVYGGSGTDVIQTGRGNQYVQAGSGNTYFEDTAAYLSAGRFDQIDNFSGGRSTDLYLPGAVQASTTFVSQNGGTAVVTAVGGGSAEIFASNTSLAAVEAHTHFTL